MPATKTCTRCGEVKSTSDFFADRRAKSGLMSRCKACAKSATRARGAERKARGEHDASATCLTCLIEKPASEFGKNWSHSTGLQYNCRECHRAIRLLRKYGLTVERYLQMLAGQGGACAVCERPQIGWLHVDHDHACCAGEKSCGKCIRGLLCGSCNRAIGLMQDSADQLVAAAMYITTRGVAETRLATEKTPSNEGV